MIKRIVRKITREKNLIFGKNEAKRLGIRFEKPNYIFKDVFDENSILVDVGCADDPDLSIFFMEEFNLKAYGVDPTRKHFNALKKISEKYSNFNHLPYAVADTNQNITFYESKVNASGSILTSHSNVTTDETIAYDVKAVTVKNLLFEINASQIDFLKLDLEGAEYGLFDKLSKEDLKSVKQLFVEFHHHAIPEKSLADTKKLVEKIKSFGFKSFTLDNANYLFYN